MLTVYEEPGKKKVYSVGPDLTSGVRRTDLTSVRYEYSYPDSNHSKVRKGFNSNVLSFILSTGKFNFLLFPML